MEELKEQLKSFIDKATVELGQYPLQEFNNWKTNLSNDEIAHILFLHSSFIYARGFHELLKEEDKDEIILFIFSSFLATFRCEPLDIQFETYFIRMMNKPESIFSKYHYDISQFLQAELHEHHWSIGDITGCFLNYKCKILSDNLGISEDRVQDFIDHKVGYLSIFRNYLTNESYHDLFTRIDKEYRKQYDQIMLRRPLWVNCTNQQQFIESFSQKFPNVSTTVWSMEDLTNNTQRLEGSEVLFFIIPKHIPENEKLLVVNLLFGSLELLSKRVLLVVLDKQVIKYNAKIHYHEFLYLFKEQGILPFYKNQELHNVIYGYGEYNVDETQYFDYFWVDK